MIAEMIGQDKLEELVSSFTERDSGPVLRCNVGDPIYHELISLVKHQLETRFQREIAHFTRDVEKARSDPKYEENREREVENALISLDIFERTKDIDYSEQLKQEAAMFGRPQFSFNGIPFHFFDPHFMAYAPIADFLRKSTEQLTLVRFDQHTDANPIDKDAIHSSNYVWHLMNDPELSPKIKEVITVSGRMPQLAPVLKPIHKDSERTYAVNGINHRTMPISCLPIIGSPVLLDVDLDGHESANITGHTGGYWMIRRGSPIWAESDNKGCVVLHPKRATYMLRERLLDVREIYVATERGWRNRLFHNRVEFDFLSSLAED